MRGIIEHKRSLQYSLTINYEEDALHLILKVISSEDNEQLTKIYQLLLTPQNFTEKVSDEVLQQFRSAFKVYGWLKNKNNFEVEPNCGKINLILRKIQRNKIVENRVFLELQERSVSRRIRDLLSVGFKDMENFKKKIKDFYSQMNLWKCEVELRKERLGLVCKEYTDGNYKGQLDNYMRNGYGKFRKNSGQIYEGQWKNDQRHGIGRVINQKQKFLFEGEFKNGKAEGRGVEWRQDGTRIEAEWKDGETNGRGIIYFDTGCRIEGKFKKGNLFGSRKFYDTNGNVSQINQYE